MFEFVKRLLGLGDRPMASHPGRVRSNMLRVAGSYPLWPVVLAVGLLVALAALLDGFDWGAWCLFALAVYVNFTYWRNTRSWFYTGDACPAAIVSEQPLLIATLTDLTAGEGEYPAVKVRREPAKRFPGDAIKLGRPVVCVARYDGTPGAKHWSNFHPRPVQCATSDDAEIKRLLSEFDRQQWADLQAAIRSLPKPLKPGLYRLSSSP